MRKFTLRIFLFLCFLGIASANSFGQFISAGGSPYTENFDGMGTSATATLPGGWKADAITTPRTVGTWAGAGTATHFSAGGNMSSSNGNGGIYNYGAGTDALGADRALGALNTSNNPTSVNLYLQLTNNAATAITDVAISYKIEKYRNGKNADSAAVQLYYFNGAAWINLGSPFYTAFAPDADNDGYATAPDASKTVSVSAGYHLPAGVVQNGTLLFAWNISQGVAGTGANASNSPGIGIDDVRIVATAGAPTALYFRSFATGNWSDLNIWEYSSDNSTWNAPPAPHYPTSFDNTIAVRTGHVVTADVNVLIDQTTVTGTLTINPGITVSVNDGPSFDLTVPGGTINGTGSLVIKSVPTGTDAGTASFGPSTGGTVSVPTTVERLISALSNRSAWRFLTAPLTGTGSIFDTWQNGGNYAAGVGTTVTGPNYTGAGTPGTPAPNGSTGLDYYTVAPSLYTFNTATQNIDAVTNTKTTLLSDPTANRGYYIFINGDRQSAWGTPNQTTLSATGSLLIGTKGFATSAAPNAITLVGNPYASAINLDLFDGDNAASSNVKSNYYYWDPYLTGWYGVGGYVTVSYPGPVITPAAGGGGSNETKFLQSGQAMFVETKSSGGAGSVTFNESQKDAASVNTIFRLQSSAVADNLRVNLNLVSGTSSLLVDGIVASFDKNYSPKVDDYDATKFQNPGESIAFMRDNKAIAVERLPLTSETVLNLNLYRLKQNATYQFEINPSISTSGLTAYLTDNYLKTTTPVDLSKPTIVNFTVNSDAASTGANRFYISFAKPAIVMAGKDGISVFPNPVTNGTINLQMNNMPQGIYNVRVFNSMGQVILTRQINHAAGSSSETIQLGKGMAKGVLQLEVVKPDNTKFASRVIAN